MAKNYSKLPSAYSLVETYLSGISKTTEEIQKSLSKRIRITTISKILETMKSSDKIKSEKKKGKTRWTKKIPNNQKL